MNTKTSRSTTQVILALLRQNPTFSRKAIADALGDITEDVVATHIDKLKASGMLKRIGSARGGYWQVEDDLPE